MLSNTLKALNSARARLAKLEARVAAERRSELSSLPAKYGFESMGDFIAALRGAGGKRRGRKPGASAGGGGKRGKRRRRAKITDETRAQVKKLSGEGKTGAEIARTLKISVPSVQNIKKALGLVKARK